MFSHTLCRHEKSDFCACFEKIYDTRKKKGQSTKCKVRALVRTSDSTRPTNVQLARLTSEPSPNDDFYTLVSQRTIIPLYTGAGFYMCPPPPPPPPPPNLSLLISIIIFHHFNFPYIFQFYSTSLYLLSIQFSWCFFISYFPNFHNSHFSISYFFPDIF